MGYDKKRAANYTRLANRIINRELSAVANGAGIIFDLLFQIDYEVPAVGGGLRSNYPYQVCYYSLDDFYFSHERPSWKKTSKLQDCIDRLNNLGARG